MYSSIYKSNREGVGAASSASQKVEAWMHRQVSADLAARTSSAEISTLEIGAGTLNQLRFEPVVGPYDIVEPFQHLYSDKEAFERVRFAYTDTSEIPLANKYDRITSVAAFEHICNLPEVVARCALLLKENGELRVAIPSEGTLIWKLGWMATTGLACRLKYNLDYGELMRHEHMSTAKEIAMVLDYFFGNITHARFGLSDQISLYQIKICTNPNFSRCMNFLESCQAC